MTCGMPGNVMPRNDHASDIPMLVQQTRQGDRGALSRLLTLADSGYDRATLEAALQGVAKSASAVIALTGSGGVGKSSLLGALAARLAEGGKRVGILACDPESPISGGALLGDRCRIAGTADVERVFIRSVSTGSGQQGMARNIDLMLAVMNRFEFDHIFVETVGAGQGDTAVRSVADFVVLVLQPQTGDSLQWEKAGILEIADVVVVNKCDLAGADHTVAEVTQQLRPEIGACVPVVKTSIARGEGLEELCRVIASMSIARRGGKASTE
jgi:LAO/AO transport system ATPase